MAGLSQFAALTIWRCCSRCWRCWPTRRGRAFTTFGWQFLVTSQWRPNELTCPARDAAGHVIMEDGEVVMKTIPPAFGALPAIYGTAVSSMLALVFAVPLSFGAALFLVRLSPQWLAAPVSFLIEFLAAIPSIAYGMWGLFVLAPFLQHYVEPAIHSALELDSRRECMAVYGDGGAGGQTLVRTLPLTGRDMFCGGLVLAIMILPIITAISRDVLQIGAAGADRRDAGAGRHVVAELVGDAAASRGRRCSGR